MRLPVALLALLAATALAACGGDDTTTGAGGATPVEGTEWLVVKGPDGAPPKAVQNLTFDAGRVSGTTGCNTISGGYTLDGGNVSLEPIASTQMACADPDVDAAEMAMQGALQKVTRWSVTGETLVLADDAGTALLTLEPATIEGDWLLIDLGGTPPVATATPTAGFMADGTLAGTSGCNRYTTTYTVDGESLTIAPAAGTKMACAEDGVMEQETAYLAALGKVAKHAVTARTLVLADGSGTKLLEYARVAELPSP